MTSVNIVETDESWALELLNESEIDDQILVHERDFAIKELSYFNHEEDSFIATELSLSAIEKQKLEQYERLKALETVENGKTDPSLFNLARIKSFLFQKIA